jgi:hypothetical protein
MEREVRNMQTLATWKDRTRGAGGLACELPASACVGVPAGAADVRAVRAGGGEGAGSTARLAVGAGLRGMA